MSPNTNASSKVPKKAPKAPGATKGIAKAKEKAQALVAKGQPQTAEKKGIFNIDFDASQMSGGS